MLTRDACELFREAFEPRGAAVSSELAAHRSACDACERWASCLERAVTAAAPRPLPPALAARLLAIGGDELPCDDVHRLFPAALAGAGEPSELAEPDRAAERHLATCARCAAVYGPIRAAAAPRRALPPGLRDRLLAIATAVREIRRPLPLWVRDGRFAVAASYLLTAALSLVVGVGDAAALLRETSTAIVVPVRELSPKTVRQPLGAALRGAWETAAEEASGRLEAARERAGELVSATVLALVPEPLEPFVEDLFSDPPPNDDNSAPQGDPDVQSAPARD